MTRKKGTATPEKGDLIGGVVRQGQSVEWTVRGQSDGDEREEGRGMGR